MKKYILLLLLAASGLCSRAQSNSATTKEKRFVEVTGYAEVEVVPDEIYIAITLRERYEGKVKLTLEKQEDSLKKRLVALGIDLKNLSLSDATSDYVRVYWRRKDALNGKDFLLKVSTAEEVGKVFQVLGELKIKEAGIAKVDHSKMEDLKRDLRIKALRDAKDKASYMLAAINEELGPVKDVSETKNYEWNFGGGAGGVLGGNAFQRDKATSVNIGGTRDYFDKYYVDGVPFSGDVELAGAQFPEVTFQKIKLNYQLQATFEIK